MKPCPACGGTVSPEAFTCPHCGQPLRKPPREPTQHSGCALVLLALLALFIYGLFQGGSGSGQAPTTAEPSPAQCRTDLHCIGEKMTGVMIGPCKRAVENLAIRDAKWDDSMLHPLLSKYGWTKEPGGDVNLVGDRIQFQNGFGNFVRYTYVCTVNPDSRTVVDAWVKEGRLQAE